ncbi:F-box protein [Legionella drancourtii]|uniref:F-box domain-containing protein n=1 Tax=Legionella drancourtii LLAP12 TaxID=658187 RepID=G9EKJ1_9GAMM|nr:F-box protein [Legionella drancourtii]EHL32342.1 hypothetical protein LDG_5726 [Legionella drancourtii LLAP12]
MTRTPRIKQKRRKEQDYLAASDNSENQIDLLSSLSDELWYKILGYCSIEDIQQLAKTNTQFRDFIAKDKTFWQQKLNTFFPPLSSPIGEYSPHAAFWRTYYLDRSQLTKRYLELFSLAKEGKEDLLEQLDHTALCKVDHYGLTILDWLRKNKHQSILDQLFKQTSFGTALKWNPLCWSIICNQEKQIIRELLEKALKQASSQTSIFAQALRAAATTGQMDLLMKTISAAENLIQINANVLDCALSGSAAHGHINLVDYCFSLEIKPTIDGRNKALIRAAENGHLAIIEQLCNIEDFPRPSARELAKPFKAAIRLGYFNIIKYLTENNQFERRKIIEGLKIAIGKKRTAIAKYLIDLQNLPLLNESQMTDLTLSLWCTAREGQREIFAYLCGSITHPDNQKQLIKNLKPAFNYAVSYDKCLIIDYIGRSPASPLKLNTKLLSDYLLVANKQKNWPSFVHLYHLAKKYNPKITNDILGSKNHLPNEIPGHILPDLYDAYYDELIASIEQLNDPLINKAKLILNQQLQVYKEKSLFNHSKRNKHLHATLLKVICDIDNYKLTTAEELAHCFECMKDTKELSDSLEQINEIKDKILADIKEQSPVIKKAKILLSFHLKNTPKDTSFFSRKQKHSRLNAAIATIIDDINTYTLTTKEELAQRFNEMQNQKEFSDSLEEIAYIMNKIFGHGYADTNEHGIRINGSKRG